MTEPLVEACEMGEKVLTDLMGTVTEEDSRFESKGLSPAFLVCDLAHDTYVAIVPWSVCNPTDEGLCFRNTLAAG